jgi:hypothetical protein
MLYCWLLLLLINLPPKLIISIFLFSNNISFKTLYPSSSLKLFPVLFLLFFYHINQFLSKIDFFLKILSLKLIPLMLLGSLLLLWNNLQPKFNISIVLFSNKISLKTSHPSSFKLFPIFIYFFLP